MYCAYLCLGRSTLALRPLHRPRRQGPKHIGLLWPCSCLIWRLLPLRLIRLLLLDRPDIFSSEYFRQDTSCERAMWTSQRLPRGLDPGWNPAGWSSRGREQADRVVGVYVPRTIAVLYTHSSRWLREGGSKSRIVWCPRRCLRMKTKKGSIGRGDPACQLAASWQPLP